MFLESIHAGFMIKKKKKIHKDATITQAYTSAGYGRHISGAGCSKLTTSLVNVLLKFQTLISEVRQYL